MDYRSVLKELEARGMMPERPPSLLPMKLGLQRLEILSQIDPKKVILVGGTNGKGSTSAALEALLIHAKQSVATYTSPHLVETTERFRLNGEDVSQRDFCEAYQAVFSKTYDLKLSHFEMLTLIAVWLFFKTNSFDWTIFEVGLGGVWDATNAIPHQYSVLSSLHFDHQKLLGRTLKSIALNKWGIIHRQGTVIHLPVDPSLRALSEFIKTSTQSRWHEAPLFPLRTQRHRKPVFNLQTPWGEAKLSLAGERGAKNSSLALEVFRVLGFQPERHLEALSSIRWPGRMEELTPSFSPCPIYLSGDHNEEGVKSLLSLLNHYSRHHLYFLVAIATDKDSACILKLLQSVPQSSLMVTSGSYRARPLEDYPENFIKVVSPLQGLHQLAKQATSQDLIVVTGSLYLVGECRKILTL